jgi:hypothetical protein
MNPIRFDEQAAPGDLSGQNRRLIMFDQSPAPCTTAVRDQAIAEMALRH